MNTTYRNVRIWDGVAEGYVDADTITIADGVISAVGGDAPSRVGEGASAHDRDMGGLTVIPGLMDAHVHMTLDPAIPTVDGQLAQSEAEIRDKMDGRAERMVRAGITTARDLGGGAWLELELRDRILRGETSGPRLLCAGQPVTSIQGHCHFWGGEASCVDEAHVVIDRQHAHAVDLIKIMATGGNLTRGSTPSMAQFSLEETRAIVDKARSLSYEVAAHCHGTAGIKNAANAGVTTIEHCSWIDGDGKRGEYDPDAIADMAAKGVFVSPTINAGWHRFKTADGSYEERIRGNFRALKAAGVALVASTDAGIPNVRHEDLAKALTAFAYFAELSPLETLMTATSNAARALAIQHVTGTITPGLAADMVFVDGDPLADLTVLEKPALVVARGEEYEENT